MQSPERAQICELWIAPFDADYEPPDLFAFVNDWNEHTERKPEPSVEYAKPPHMPQRAAEVEKERSTGDNGANLGDGYLVRKRMELYGSRRHWSRPRLYLRRPPNNPTVSRSWLCARWADSY